MGQHPRIHPPRPENSSGTKWVNIPEWWVNINQNGGSTWTRIYKFFVNSKQVAAETDFHNHDVEVPIEIEGVFLKEAADDTDTDLVGRGKKAEPDWVNKWVDGNGLVRVKKIWRTVDAIGEKFTFSPAQHEWVKDGFGGMPSLFQKYSPTPIGINAMETETTLEDKVNKLIQEEMLKKLREDFPKEFEDLLTGVKELQGKILGSDFFISGNQILLRPSLGFSWSVNLRRGFVLPSTAVIW